MFLLVSVRHVGAQPDGHQHDVSIQISINFVKKFLRISLIRNIPLAWILARVSAYLPPFYFPDSGLYLLKAFDFDFDLFWMAWHQKPAIVWLRFGYSQTKGRLFKKKRCNVPFELHKGMSKIINRQKINIRSVWWSFSVTIISVISGKKGNHFWSRYFWHQFHSLFQALG